MAGTQTGGTRLQIRTVPALRAREGGVLFCSIRVGGATGANGLPTGYAPMRTEVQLWMPSIDIAETASASIDIAEKASGSISDFAIQSFAADFSAGSFDAQSAGISALSANAGLNAIALENMKPGSPESEWLISAHDDNIEGFAAQFSLNHGETVDFKINTDSTDYRIDIYRLGYYNGDGARKVASFENILATPQVQLVPLFDPTLKLVDAGNWSVSASWTSRSTRSPVFTSPS